MTDKIYIKWEEFHQDVKNLCKQIKAQKKIDKIVIALILLHILETNIKN